MTRQIILDTETTGLELAQGNRIVEIGCVELLNRRVTEATFHHYLNPERDSEYGALQVHGLTTAFLSQKPKFAEVAPALIEFIRGAELIIHNADFDVGFLNAELERAGYRERIESLCRVTDSVQLARKLRPGQKSNLDALCKHYGVDNSARDLHGALLDARLLADVYLAMTGGQSALLLERAEPATTVAATRIEGGLETGPLPVIVATAEELAAHEARLAEIEKKSKVRLWPAAVAVAA